MRTVQKKGNISRWKMSYGRAEFPSVPVVTFKSELKLVLSTEIALKD